MDDPCRSGALALDFFSVRNGRKALPIMGMIHDWLHAQDWRIPRHHRKKGSLQNPIHTSDIGEEWSPYIAINPQKQQILGNCWVDSDESFSSALLHGRCNQGRHSSQTLRRCIAFSQAWISKRWPWNRTYIFLWKSVTLKTVVLLICLRVSFHQWNLEEGYIMLFEKMIFPLLPTIPNQNNIQHHLRRNFSCLLFWRPPHFHMFFFQNLWGATMASSTRRGSRTFVGPVQGEDLPVSKLPLFSHGRDGHQSSDVQGLYTHYKDSLLKVGFFPSPIYGL